MRPKPQRASLALPCPLPNSPIRAGGAQQRKPPPDAGPTVARLPRLHPRNQLGRMAGSIMLIRPTATARSAANITATEGAPKLAGAPPRKRENGSRAVNRIERVDGGESAPQIRGKQRHGRSNPPFKIWQLTKEVCPSVRLWLYLESLSRSLSLWGHRIQGPRTNELMRIRRRTLRKDEVPPWRGR